MRFQPGAVLAAKVAPQAAVGLNLSDEEATSRLFVPAQRPTPAQVKRALVAELCN